MPPITIADPDSGSTATILPELGFNCFSFCPVVSGRAVEVLWAEPEFGPGHRPSRSGIPILFPFPGRIRNGAFRWEGRDYAITGAQTNSGNAIHGFVMTRPWRVTEHLPSRIAALFQASIDDPSLLEQWPADFRIGVAYSVRDASLTMEVGVENPGARPLPFGFGTHPYFRLPLGGQSADDCLVQVGASEVAEQREQLPTGQWLPIDPPRDLRRGARYGALTLDDIVRGIPAGPDGRIQTTVTDPASGLTLHQTAAADLPYYVIFTPVHREAIAIEPYTTLPNAFELIERGFDPKLRVLAPGDRWTTTITLTLRRTDETRR